MRAFASIALSIAFVACTGSAAPRLLGPPIKAGDAVDYSCRVDADCAIKDVGNCCGTYPTCVNRDSPTFPERVRDECEKQGKVGVCGFPAVKACACVEGRCSNLTDDRAPQR